MSYIHEALKKAQKERDARYQRYNGVLTSSGGRERPFSAKVIWWTCLPLSIILLAIGTYSWLDYGSPKSTTTSQFKYRKPAKPSRQQGLLGAKELFERGRAFYKRGRVKDSKRLYKRALKLDPGNVDALNDLGVIYIHDKDYSEARGVFERAIRLRPKNVDAYYNLACLYSIMGDISQSLTQLKKAVSLNQDVKGWAKMDSDLEGVRGTPEFEAIMND